MLVEDSSSINYLKIVPSDKFLPDLNKNVKCDSTALSNQKDHPLTSDSLVSPNDDCVVISDSRQNDSAIPANLANNFMFHDNPEYFSAFSTLRKHGIPSDVHSAPNSTIQSPIAEIQSPTNSAIQPPTVGIQFSSNTIVQPPMPNVLPSALNSVLV